GSCICPANTRVCPQSNSCIGNAQCCTTADCSVSGQTCSGPGGSCACPAGKKVCTASNSCIPNGNCCTNADCPATSQVTATTCTSGACQVLSCVGGFFNVDGRYDDGCECQDLGRGRSCGNPTGLGVLTLGGTLNVGGNLPAAN